MKMMMFPVWTSYQKGHDARATSRIGQFGSASAAARWSRRQPTTPSGTSTLSSAANNGE
jgi:hypothetical protein